MTDKEEFLNNLDPETRYFLWQIVKKVDDVMLEKKNDPGS